VDLRAKKGGEGGMEKDKIKNFTLSVNKRMKSMKMKIIGISCFIMFFIHSCSMQLFNESGTKLNKPCKNVDEGRIFGINYSFPQKPNLIGKVRTKGNFFSDFSLEKSIEVIRKSTCFYEGNALRIIKIKEPSIVGSKSYDIEAEVIRLDSFPERKAELLCKDFKFDTTAYYINIKRSNKILGSAGCYPLYIDNEFICSIENGKEYKIRLKNTESQFQIEFLNEVFSFQFPFKKGKIENLEFKFGLSGKPILSLKQ
jgi:hypothetical protein